MTSSNKIKGELLGKFLAEVHNSLVHGVENQILALILYYEFTCAKNNEYEKILQEMLYFDGDISSLVLPLNNKWILNAIGPKNTFIKDITLPAWSDDSLKNSQNKLCKEMNSLILKNFEEFVTSPNLLALIIYFERLNNIIEKEGFETIPIISDFENMRNEIKKSSKDTTMPTNVDEIFNQFKRYSHLNKSEKKQCLIKIFCNLISLNTKVFKDDKHSKESMNIEQDVDKEKKLWDDTYGLLENVEICLSENITNFLKLAFARSKLFGQFPTPEGCNYVNDFMYNIYFFSRYTGLDVSPSFLGLSKEDSINPIIDLLLNKKDFEKEVADQFANFYKLYASKNIENFILQLTCFCFAPSSIITLNSTKVTEDNQMIQVNELAKEIILQSILKNEILKFLTMLTKRINKKNKDLLPEEPLQRIFTVCCEYLISHKELSTEELPEIYKLMSFEKEVVNRKLYFNLFIEIKKFSYLLKNLHIYTESSSKRYLAHNQSLKLGNILTKIFTNCISSDFSKINSKIGFMASLCLPLDESLNNSGHRQISVDFLNWARQATNLDAFNNIHFTEQLLKFAIVHMRPISELKKAIQKVDKNNKSSLITFLLEKNPLSVLQIFSKLGSEIEDGPANQKEQENGSAHKNLSVEKKNLNDPSQVKKVSKKVSFNKLGKRKTEPSKKAFGNRDDSDPFKSKSLENEQQISVQDVASNLYQLVISQAFQYFESNENLIEFEDLLRTRLLKNSLDFSNLSKDFALLKEANLNLDIADEELYLLISQNEFYYILKLLKVFSKEKIETIKADHDNNIEVLVGIFNTIIKVLLEKLQAAKTKQSSVEMENAIGLIMECLSQLAQSLPKDNEINSKSRAFGELLYTLLKFICETDLTLSSENEVNI